MDGQKRMKFFRSLPAEIDQIPYRSGAEIAGIAQREFKSTSFLITQPRYTLPLSVVSPPWLSPVFNTPPHGRGSRAASRSDSKDRLAANLGADLDLNHEGPSPSSTCTTLASELLLLNPTSEPPLRAISYVKYILRCAGILYHIQPPCDDLSRDLPSTTAPGLLPDSPILHCVLILPNPRSHMSPATTLLTQMRPPLARAQTIAARSSSSPPSHFANTQQAKKSDSLIRCLEFWIQMIPVYSTFSCASRSASRKRSGASRSRCKTKNGKDRPCTKLRIRISDEHALPSLKKALNVGSLPEDSEVSQEKDPGNTELEEDARGRPRDSRRLSNVNNSSQRPLISRSITDGSARTELRSDHMPYIVPSRAQSRLRRGFFDFVDFAKRSSSLVGTSSNVSTPVTPISANAEASPPPLAFAVM